MRSAFRQISRSSCYRTPIVGRLSLPAFHFIRSGCVGPRRQFSTGRGQWSNKLHRETRSTFSQDDSTIYALSTAPGRAAIAVIRISGPSCVEIYHSLCPTKPLPKPRYAAVRTLYDPITAPTQDSILDSNALVLFFPAPNSSTGEDVLELHIHGGPAITTSVLRALSRCTPTASTPPIRHAEPGEFTRRAFLNNRLDLTQVEALSDVLCAQTEQQRRLSVRGTSGRLARTYEDWRARLLRARAELEALIDFQEDQHFDEEPAVLAASVAGQVVGLKRRIERHVVNAMRGELLRNGIGIALLGAPNAGKSSLLNRVVGREAAIVSQEAGTTRDVVEVGLDVGGYFCRLGDMAGLRGSGNSLGMTGDITQAQAQLTESSVGKIEEEGIRRAKQRALESDLLIVVISVELDRNGEPHLPFPSDVLSTANECESEIVVVINKIDLIPLPNRQPLIATWAAALGPRFTNLESDRVFPISCKLASADSECQPEAIDPVDPDPDPGNIQAFLHGLEAVFKRMTEPVPHRPDQHPTSAADDPSLLHYSLGASERHKLLLEECRGHLDAFLGQVNFPDLSAPTGFERLGEKINGRREEDIDIVIAAESLRAAADCLARITGRGEAGDVEEVLGVVFEKFCVGK